MNPPTHPLPVTFTALCVVSADNAHSSRQFLQVVRLLMTKRREFNRGLLCAIEVIFSASVKLQGIKIVPTLSSTQTKFTIKVSA
jgi:hypothetical protein